MDLIVEGERRREDFLGGIEVRLNDGQLWTLPKPRVRIRPVRDASGMRLVGLFTFGDAYNAKWEAFAGAVDSRAQRAALLDLAFDLLQRNYKLSDDELSDLLAWDPEDDAGAERLEALAAIVSGDSPKASPGGTGSPSP
jgi:hypothetical protein